MTPTLTESELTLFVESVRRYFWVTTGQTPQVTSAYLGVEAVQTHGYTGTVQFAGSHRGQVLVSMPGPLLRELLELQHEANFSDTNLLDAVGEIANTLAGNARQALGPALQISVPTTQQGRTSLASSASHPPYAITLRWNHQPALVCVHLERC